MKIRLLVIALLLSSACQAQDEAALCARLTLDEVRSVLGNRWMHEDDVLDSICRYTDSGDATRYLELRPTDLNREGWITRAESGRGQVEELSGLVVADYNGHGFGARDEVLVEAGDALITITVAEGVDRDQAVKIAGLIRAD